MKKLLLLTLLAIAMLPTYAQTSVGVIAGYNLNWRHQNYTYYPNGMTDDSRSMSSWRAGVITEHHLAGKFYLQPQLLLNNKSERFRFSQASLNLEGEGRSRLLYLELQANALFKHKIGNNAVFLGAGPYVSHGINGVVFRKGTVHSTDLYKFEEYNVVKFRNEGLTNTSEYNEYNTSYKKPIDAGINIQLGYECKNGLFFNSVYSYGITNMAYLKDYTSKHRYVGLSVGYYLKRIS